MVLIRGFFKLIFKRFLLQLICHPVYELGHCSVYLLCAALLERVRWWTCRWPRRKRWRRTENWKRSWFRGATHSPCEGLHLSHDCSGHDQVGEVVGYQCDAEEQGAGERQGSGVRQPWQREIVRSIDTYMDNICIVFLPRRMNFLYTDILMLVRHWRIKGVL